MVIQILLTQRDTIEPLSQKLGQRVIDEAGIAPVVETSRQRAGQNQAVIDLAEQERAAVGGEVAAGEIGDDFAGTEVLKEQRLLGTVCRKSGGGVRSVLAFIHSLSDALPASPLNLV